MTDGRVSIDTRLDTSGLKKGIQSIPQQMQKMTKSVMQLGTAIGLAFSVRQIISFANECNKMYSNQIVQETKLATIMRQRMNATDEQIAQVKELASEQQKIGVIGDEVQLAGIQQVATFIKSTESIKTLLPAMNDLLAQQKGLNATEQDAVSIGSMLGKALQGQTDILKRVGISFSDAEANVLKYGNESEKVAMLSQVIKNNVGEMNKELAQTDAGKQKQLANTMGDLKEEFGQSVATLKNVFLPVMARVVRVFTNITDKLKVFSNTVKKVFGSSVKNIDNTTKSTGNLATATQDVVDAQKEMVGGYDKLNVIADDTTDTSSDVEDVSNLIDIFGKFDKQVDDTSIKLEKFFDAFKSGNWASITTTLTKKLNSAINAVSKADLSGKAEIVAKRISSALNGHINTMDYEKTGRAIGKFIRAGIDFLSTILTETNWQGHFVGIGDAIATTINTVTSKPSRIEKLGKGLKNFIVSALDGVEAFFKKTDFKKIGNTIVAFINGADLPKITNQLGDVAIAIADSIADCINGITEDSKAFKDLGKALSNIVVKGLKAINDFVKKTDWKKVGQAIGDFISSIDWGQIIFELGSLALNLCSAIGNAIKGLSDSSPIFTAIVSLILGAKLLKASGSFGNGVTASGTIGSGFNIKGIACKIGLVFTAAATGWNLGKAISNAFFTEDINKIYENMTFKEKWNDFWEGFHDLWRDTMSGVIIKATEKAKEQVISGKTATGETAKKLAPWLFGTSSNTVVSTQYSNASTNAMVDTNPVPMGWYDLMLDETVKSRQYLGKIYNLMKDGTEIVIDGKTVFQVVKKQNDSYKKANGKSAFA